MNKKQKICLWVGIIVVVIMGLYPPWMVGLTVQGLYCTTGKYSFILNPAGDLDESMQIARRIDLAQLVVQWAMAAIVTGGLIVTFKDKKPNDEEKE